MNIKFENKEQKEIISDYREQNFELREDLGTYKNELIYKNKYIDTLNKNIEELVELNQQLKTQRDNWENEYYEVVNENDKQDEYIIQLEYKNIKLKQELFNLYLNQFN